MKKIYNTFEELEQELKNLNEDINRTNALADKLQITDWKEIMNIAEDLVDWAHGFGFGNETDTDAVLKEKILNAWNIEENDSLMNELKNEIIIAEKEVEENLAEMDFEFLHENEVNTLVD